MTTAGFVSGTRDETTPTRLSRVAAAASLLLGLALIVVLPAVADAVSYVGVLAAAAAATAIVAGSCLWCKDTAVVRAAAAVAAGTTLAVQLLQLVGALPGARGLGRVMVPESLGATALSLSVIVLLVVDARCRRPEQAPDHPYAL